MCGICGVFRVGGEGPVLPRHVLDRMTDSMTHRGPDDRGTIVYEGVALGVRRLSIVDVEGGHQPFPNEDASIWAAQNGELYNHAAIREELRADGHVFNSRCDTEVLPHLYERDGLAFPARLRGMFGLALWDARRRRGVVARDRLGIKPVYYATVGDLVIFGSELKSVLASGLVEPRLDPEALDLYLTFGFMPGPWTLLQGVRKLLPGHLLVVDPDGVRTERWWSFPRPEPEQGLDEAEWAERLLAELDTSVRMRLMADVPLGAMLSGGLDSSLIVALMARHATEPVKTFSIGFEEDGEGNELADARYVSSVYGTEHHEVQLSYARDSVDLAELVWHMDEPMAELSALGFYALSQLASRHVKVALSGQGADELVGGYTKHRAATLVAAWQRLPGPLAHAGNAVARRAPRRFARPARTLVSGDPAERLVAMSGRVDDAMRRTLYTGMLSSQHGTVANDAVAAIADGVDGDPLAETLFIDGQLALVDDMLHYFDRTSMAHSLEVRVPFLDHHVVELCARIPSDMKVRRLRTKVVLKRAARGVVPDRIIDKRKLGFLRAASSGWFRAQIPGAVSDYLLSSNPRCAEFLDRTTLERMINDQDRHGENPNIHLLLSILMLEIWLSTYVPRAVAPSTEHRERIALGG